MIVGGGITGAICAYLFSRARIRVAVLESNTIGRASTAASTALLMQEPDRDFRDLVDRFGRRRARAVWMALSRATRELAETIRSLKLKCELHTRESIYFTVEPSRVAVLRKEFEARKKAGLPGRWLSSAALYRRTGMTAQAAIATLGNAQVDPMRACHGFLSAARTRGAKIFERSPVLRVKPVGDGVLVYTPRGMVSARAVIVATGYAPKGFEPLAGRFTLKDTYVIATRAVPRARRRQLQKSMAMAWDTDRPYHYLRWTDQGRLLVGGEDTRHRTVRGSRSRIAKASKRLTAFLGRIYPSLAGQTPDYAWEGLFAETPDGLPYIGTHAHYPRHLFALGYGGNGMTASYLAARLLIRHYRTPGTRGDGARDLFAFRRGRG